MAAFIVISADDRLHYIVDGIEKCRPFNPDVSAEISTGKIIKSKSGYIYEYTIHGEGCKSKGEKSFSNLLSNQLAAYRLAYTIPEDELVNIFFLENPLTETELEESELWINEFDEVYKSGKGNDTNFCLFRVVFTYDHNNPCDVSTKMDRQVLERLISTHKESISNDSKSFDRYIFYIDNQKSDSAALCLRKDEHDFKLPRFLLDFMMLVSDENDNYNVKNAINPATVTTRCFSVGFAESMYYYPDVERYYRCADIRDLNWAILFSSDEKSGENGKEIMDIEKYPFGLRERKNRLREIYKDIPFIEDIAHYENSADYKINKYISELKELLKKEREKEREDFKNSEDVMCLQKNIESLNNQIDCAQQADDESIEDFGNRLKLLTKDKQEKETEYNKIILEFEPKCPLYIDRDEMYLDLSISEDGYTEIINEKTRQYFKLVEFVMSKQFLDFVKKDALVKAQSEDETRQKNEVDTNKTKQNSGCLFFLFFWKKKQNNENADTPSNSTLPTHNSFNPLEMIKGIKKQLDLKKSFLQFVNDVNSIESNFAAWQKECDEFKLTEHENHYLPIIDLAKLQEEQKRTSSERLKSCVAEWRKETNPTKTSLFDLIRIQAAKYTRNSFPFVIWQKPYPFVRSISLDGNLAEICNQLQKRSAPIVNYNLTTALKEDKITRILFSDRPKFNEEIQQIRSKLQKGSTITGIESKHIASKICMFQFLPMDDAILENLVDLQSSVDNIDTSL